MPRLKNPDARRQRSLRACVFCRKRKEKCDGEQPCAKCEKRGLDCLFSSQTAEHTRPYSLPRGSSRGVNAESTLEERPEISERPLSNISEADAHDQDNDDSSPHTAGHRYRQGSSGNSSEAPVAQTASLLTDTHGKLLIYIGDSASISLLSNIRRLVSTKIGECDFTNDTALHSFLEQPLAAALDMLQETPPENPQLWPKPTIEEAEMLMDQFFAATSCLLDIFDRTDLLQSFQTWIDGPSHAEDLASCILYLVLSIGAQSMNDSIFNSSAIRYFSLAREIIPYCDTDEPSLQTIQCYTLIARYLLGACRRNAAYMNFGTATRAAYALGLHRADLYKVFPEPGRRSRERIWHSLRIMDLFLSATLGRPPSTSDFEGYRPSLDDSDPEDCDRTKKQMTAALSRLCPILETILDSVYENRGVSTKVAHEISRSHREWATGLPELPEDSEENPLSMSMALGLTHLLGAYHWSIMLLTRPFLMFVLSSNNSHSEATAPRSKTSHSVPTAATFADACVDSAMQALDHAADLLKHKSLPRRLPFILNTVFIAGISVAASCFGDYDRYLPIQDAMDKAERLLSFMQVDDPHAERFAKVMTRLRKAVIIYVNQREQMSMQQRNSLKRSLFGSVGPERLQNNTRQSKTSASGSSRPRVPNATDQETYNEMSLPDSDYLQTPMSINLSSQQASSLQNGNQRDCENANLTMPQFRAERSSDDAINYSSTVEAQNYTIGDALRSEYSDYQHTFPSFGLFDNIDSNTLGNFLVPSFPY